MKIIDLKENFIFVQNMKMIYAFFYQAIPKGLGLCTQKDLLIIFILIQMILKTIGIILKDFQEE